MVLFKTGRLVKTLIISLCMALVIALCPYSFRVTFAEENDEQLQIDAQEVIDIATVIENGLDKNGSGYVLDVKYAEKKGLPDYVIHNLQDYLDQAKSSEVKQAISQADNFKNEVKEVAEENNGDLVSLHTIGNDGYAASPTQTMMTVFKVVLWGVVGVTLANKVVEDAYALGMYKACHKWGHKHPKVKKACKVTGHW